MCSTSDIRGGWIDSSIGELVEDYPELIGKFPLALITYVDSTPATTLPDIQHAIEEGEMVGEKLGTGFLTTGSSLVKLGRDGRFFDGFDEVWFYRQKPATPKPENVVIVGPKQIGDSVPAEIISWMRRSRCFLALGDGDGLNYVATDKCVADLLARV